MNIAFINRPNGDLTFTGQLTAVPGVAGTGSAAADFLLGLPQKQEQKISEDGMVLV